MRLSSLEFRALKVLDDPKSVEQFGAGLWPARTGRIVRTRGGSDVAALFVLGSLRQRGLARLQHAGSVLWERSPTGNLEVRSWVPPEEISIRCPECGCRSHVSRPEEMLSHMRSAHPAELGELADEIEKLLGDD